MQFFRLPRQFREHVAQYEQDKQSQLNSINNLTNSINDITMDKQLKFKETNNKIKQVEDKIDNKIKQAEDKIDENNKNLNNKIKQAEDKIDENNKNLSKYKQKFNNYKKANNRKIKDLEAKINLVQETQKTILDTMNMFGSFFNRMFGDEFNNINNNVHVNTVKESDNKINSENNFRMFSNNKLRRTNSFFFSTIDTNDTNGNNNLNNSFTVFNRKNDIVPNLEEKDIRENNKQTKQ